MPAKTPPECPEIYERIRDAMRRAGNVSLSDLASKSDCSKHGWHQRLRSKHVGTYLPELAKLLGVEEHWLRYGSVSNKPASGIALKTATLQDLASA